MQSIPRVSVLFTGMAVTAIFVTDLAAVDVADCRVIGECTGLYSGEASSIQRQKRQGQGQEPPTFEGTLPGEGAVFDVCEAFRTAVTDEKAPLGSGMEPFVTLQCGAKYQYEVGEYVRSGSPTSAIEYTDTVSIQTMTQQAIGGSVSLGASYGGLSGTVTGSVLNTNGTSWTTTVTINHYIWTATYVPQKQPSNRTQIGTCGTRDSTLVPCAEP